MNECNFIDNLADENGGHINIKNIGVLGIDNSNYK